MAGSQDETRILPPATRRRPGGFLSARGFRYGRRRVGICGGPQGQLTWGVHTTLAPTWFDPAETPGIITPWMVLYALHDALVKPMRATR